MYYAWRLIRYVSAMAGLILLFLAVGTSDYYVIELGETEPQSVTVCVVIGVVLLIPMIIHGLWEMHKESK